MINNSPRKTLRKFSKKLFVFKLCFLWQPPHLLKETAMVKCSPLSFVSLLSHDGGGGVIYSYSFKMEGVSIFIGLFMSGTKNY